MLLRSMLVMSRIALMSLANVNLPQKLRFLSLMPESHATSCGVISPVDCDKRFVKRAKRSSHPEFRESKMSHSSHNDRLIKINNNDCQKILTYR